MLFVEARFFLFFLILFGIYWSLRDNFQRKFLLLAASYFFYACWDWRFAIMLFGLSLADFYFANAIFRSSNTRLRKQLVVGSILMNMGVLCFFKYFNFFTDSAIRFGNFFGFQLSQFTIDVILPVGISFFTFQSLSYTIDVYRGQFKPAKRIIDYLLSAAFFPQLVAGPIVRPTFFLPQLASRRIFPIDEVRPLLALFLLGFIKKACIADNVSPYVDQVFAEPGAYAALSTIGAVWLYATQIYCDFSGYTDMAIASAGLLGYRLVINFNAPYLANSIQDFWRRWHISLSEWIRDYIYISLGGRSPVRLLTYRNLLITMLLGGLWHGAAWTFVVWGGLHGIALVVQREYHRLIGCRFTMPSLAGWFLTINFVCISWIFFRSESFATALTVLSHYLLLSPGGGLQIPTWLIVFPSILLLLELIGRKRTWFESFASLTPTRFSLAYGSAWAIAIAFLPLGYRPFIYFQF